MSFPFPSNPVDGQVATQTLPDGTVLRATYKQSKNEWTVEQVRPKPSSINLISGTAYTVAPGSDGQVLTYDSKLNQWVGKAPSSASGGTGQTYTKGTQAAANTPNPPDPTKPTELLVPGALQTTLENLHKELKAWDGTAWVNVLTEEEIKQWISAGSLFRGVIKEAGLSTLPDVSTSNRGFYWSWTGSPGYVVQTGDAKIGKDLVNEVLQVGDWIQSDGTKWVHVPGDLLSKQRWDSLGSFAPWSDTSWESGSVVSYQRSFFRANALISPGDLAPGAAGSKWTDITPLPSMNTGDLANVNANTINPGQHGMVFQWDDNVQEWVASDTLDVAEVKTGGIKFGDLNGEIQFVTDDLSTVPSFDEDITVPNVYALKEYVTNQPKPFLEELDDCKELASAADGQVPAWSNANSRWEPVDTTTSVARLTDVDLTVAPANGQHLQWDAIASKWKAGTADLDALSDVALTGTADNQILKYDLASTSWQNWTPDFLNTANGYTKTEVDNKLTALATGLEHEISVLAIADTPPASPTLDQVYIVGATPTGAWTGQNNNLARWDGAAWVFDAPRNKEAHLVEAALATYSWNGTNWVKVATASTSGSAAAGDIWTVGSIQQSMLSEPQWATALGAEATKWAIADGRDVSGSKYATLTGNNKIPDLRGAYLRMAGKNASNTSWNGGTLAAFQEDATARPKAAFTTNSAGDHKHAQGFKTTDATYAFGYQSLGTRGDVASNAVSGNWAQQLPYTSNDGAHTHTVDGGGDAETRPKSYGVNYFIKIN